MKIPKQTWKVLGNLNTCYLDNLTCKLIMEENENGDRRIEATVYDEFENYIGEFYITVEDINQLNRRISETYKRYCDNRF